MAAITGTDCIRSACAQRARDGGLQRLARDLNLSLTLLDEFTYHRGKLPSEALRLLATDLFAGMAEFDADLNLLRATNRAPAISGGTPSPRYDPKAHPPVPINRGGVTLSTPLPGGSLQPARPTRAGWVSE